MFSSLGWALFYTDLVRLEDVVIDEIKKADDEADRWRKDCEARDVPLQEGDACADLENAGEGGVFDSDVETVLGCEDNFEYDEER